MATTVEERKEFPNAYAMFRYYIDGWRNVPPIAGLATIRQTMLAQWENKFSEISSKFYETFKVPFTEENAAKYLPTPFFITTRYEKLNFFEKIAKMGSDLMGLVGKLPAALGDFGKIVVLAPFKKAMKKSLDKHGIDSSNKLGEIAEKFYNRIVRKETDGFQYGANNPWQSLEKHISENSQYTFVKGRGFDGFDCVEPISTMALITAILEFFKNMLGNPNADREVTSLAESGLNNSTQLINAEIAAMNRGDDAPADNDGKGFKLDGMNIILLLILVYVLFGRK